MTRVILYLKSVRVKVDKSYLHKVQHELMFLHKITFLRRRDSH